MQSRHAYVGWSYAGRRSVIYLWNVIGVGTILDCGGRGFALHLHTGAVHRTALHSHGQCTALDQRQRPRNLNVRPPRQQLHHPKTIITGSGSCDRTHMKLIQRQKVNKPNYNTRQSLVLRSGKNIY